MILSDADIQKAIAKREIVFFPKLVPGQLSGASVDLTLSSEFWKFKREFSKRKSPVDLSLVSFKDATEKTAADSVVLAPGEMCLGKTAEKITLSPSIMGSLEGRSRFARMGLAVHVTSALVQPGSDNHQVLEIVNLAPFPIKLHAGMRISQVVFERLETPSRQPYAKFGKIAKKQ